MGTLSQLGPIVTFVVGGFAIGLYLWQKADHKREAAKLIIQEIRRAEQIISDYKETNQYQFAKKIIATNSWNKNIHLFVGNLTNDELDRISDLYSTGEYLDSLISDISKITLQHDIDTAKAVTAQPQLIQTNGQPQALMIPTLVPVWKDRLDAISLKIETIFHSTIVGKLKKIARIQ